MNVKFFPLIMEHRETNDEKIRRKMTKAESFNGKLFIVTKTLAKIYKGYYGIKDHKINTNDNNTNNKDATHTCLMPEILSKFGISHQCFTSVKEYHHLCDDCSRLYQNLSRVEPIIYGTLSNGKPSKFSSTSCIIPHCTHLRHIISNPNKSSPNPESSQPYLHISTYPQLKSCKYSDPVPVNDRDILLSGCKEHICGKCKDKYHEDSMFTFLVCLKILNSPLYRSKDTLGIISELCRVELIIMRPGIALCDCRIHRCFDRQRMTAFDYVDNLIDNFNATKYLNLETLEYNIKVISAMNKLLGGKSDVTTTDQLIYCHDIINKYNDYVVSKKFCPEELSPCLAADIYNRLKSRYCLVYVDPLMKFLRRRDKEYRMINYRSPSDICHCCYIMFE